MSLIMKLARQAQREADKASRYDKLILSDDFEKNEYRRLVQTMHDAQDRQDGLCDAIASIKAETLDEATVQLVALSKLVEDISVHGHDMTSEQYKANRQATWRLLFSIFDILRKDCQIDPAEYCADIHFPPWCDPWRTEEEDLGGRIGHTENGGGA